MTIRIGSILLCAALLLCLCACGTAAVPPPTADPYAGMVEVDSGYGTLMWTKLYEDVPASAFRAEDFRRDGQFINYTGNAFTALRGIDVSEHQQEIDWKAVAGDGVEFAMIRAGYRGYSEGGLFEDPYFRRNMTGAADAGLQRGVYFFSQAVSVEEAQEEAAYLLKLIDGYDLELPVVYDWETISTEQARTDAVDGQTLSACAAAFCEQIQAAGYDACVYAYRYLAYFYYDLSQLAPYQLWIGAIGDAPDFYYTHNMWQYTDSGEVAGIAGAVDLNLLFTTESDARSDTDSAMQDSSAENDDEKQETGEQAA